MIYHKNALGITLPEKCIGNVGTITALKMFL